MDELDVDGDLPDALQGTYLRNGANPAFAPLGTYHPFDGDGMLHAVSVRDGCASYRNRWVESKGLELERRAGEVLFGGLADMRLPAPEVMAEAGPFKNVANTNVIRHNNRILALWEAGLPTEVDAKLATIGEYDFAGAYQGPFTAHPFVDCATGELLTFGYQPMPPFLRYHVIDASGAVAHSTEIDLARPVMMHDFAATESRCVFLDAPAVMDLSAFQTSDPFVSWQPDLGARFGVIDRYAAGDTVDWYEIDPCFVYHFMNAWDDGDKIELVCARWPRLLFDAAEMDLGSDATLHRFTIDPVSSSVACEQLDDRRIEFPRVDDRRRGRPSRFGHCATSSADSAMADFDSIVRYDLATGDGEVYCFGSGHFVGEAVFAADPDGDGEDDGWLVAFVYDVAADTSRFCVLDAADIASGPVAAVELGRRVPFGFHGSWLPE